MYMQSASLPKDMGYIAITIANGHVVMIKSISIDSKVSYV